MAAIMKTSLLCKPKLLFSLCILIGLLLGIGANYPLAHAQNQMNDLSSKSAQTTEIVELDPSVSDDLAAYDLKQDPKFLQDAGDQARHLDGDDITDPARAMKEGKIRLANWIAILSRFAKDDRTNIDLQNPPLLAITPPGPAGQQYPAGIDPADVKDPVLRQRYKDAIEQNRVYADRYKQAMRRKEIHENLLTSAFSSLQDAREKLGLSTVTMRSALNQADLASSDRNTLLSVTTEK